MLKLSVSHNLYTVECTLNLNDFMNLEIFDLEFIIAFGKYRMVLQYLAL